MKQIPIDVITGSRGAGKTTWIKTLKKHHVWSGDVPIFLNEEGSEAYPDDMRVYPVMGGCICCAMQSEFADKVKKLTDQEKVDGIIVELSGNGSIKEFFKVLPFLSECCIHAVFYVLNLKRFPKQRLMMEEKLKEQIRYAPVVVIKHIEEAAPEEYQRTVTLLHEWNPEAILLPVDEQEKIVCELFREWNAKTDHWEAGEALNIREVYDYCVRFAKIRRPLMRMMAVPSKKGVVIDRELNQIYNKT